MGLLTPRGEDGEEGVGELSLSGLDALDARGSDDDDVLFELDEWPEEDRAVLAAKLRSVGVPHTWESTTLVIAASDEAWAERIMDQVEEDLAGSDAGIDDDTQVAYDLSGWDDDSCVALLDALSAETIPYGLDGEELYVDAADEARVDEILVALSTPGAALVLGGPVSQEAMSELFVAADRLSHDATHREAAASLVAGARTAAASAAPYGMDPGWWDGVVARAGALADLLQTEAPEAELVEGLAGSLREELRPVV